MGQCGCGDFGADVRFPGPDGGVYTLRVYRPCDYCSTPAGVVLARFSSMAAAAEWGVDTRPALTFTDSRYGQYEGIEEFVRVLDPEALAATLATATDEHETVRDFSGDVAAVREAIEAAMLEVLEECRSPSHLSSEVENAGQSRQAAPDAPPSRPQVSGAPTDRTQSAMRVTAAVRARLAEEANRGARDALAWVLDLLSDPTAGVERDPVCRNPDCDRGVIEGDDCPTCSRPTTTDCPECHPREER